MNCADRVAALSTIGNMPLDDPYGHNDAFWRRRHDRAIFLAAYAAATAAFQT
ncbi:hypothetical protein [Sphingomonas sp. TREG-RG-20F-R18-01]|uniref:hypothetical protein n=1 Tax=Sphingomonas sp. TREG-RG-20F-R18-01 TaxID=2914982 RepID=UPI001F56A0D8|nr:hypothetical protein [Sphingomonas sp. TREG-RG-20F-R18-01]